MTATVAVLDVVPPAMRDAAVRAIEHAQRTVFAGTTLTSLTPLSGGMSGAHVYLVHLGNGAQVHECVLRIVTERTALNDPARALVCARLASDAGVAPPLLYSDIDAGVSLSVRVVAPAVPQRRDAAQLGALLRTLHSAPAFPKYLTTFDAIDGGLAQLAQYGVQLPRLLHAVVHEYTTLKSTLTPHLVLASCHNDLNPGNVLTDGTRSWLVDWDSAGLNDPMFDVGSIVHWFRLDRDREQALMHAYFDRAPTEIERAKLTLMKQVVWCYYMLVFLLIALPDGGVGDMETVEPQDIPRFADFIDGVMRGEHQLHVANTRRRLSLVMAQEFLAAMPGTETTAALSLLTV